MSVWRKTIAVLLACGCCALLPDSAGAQSTMDLPAPQAQFGPMPRGNRPPGLPPLRDPTQPSPAVREAIEAAQAGPPGAKGAPGIGPATPQMRLKARIISNRTPPVAIVEIDGSPFTVRRDTTLVLSGASSGMQVHVIDLSPTEVRLELLPATKIFIMN